jgi:hypothetical protein
VSINVISWAYDPIKYTWLDIDCAEIVTVWITVWQSFEIKVVDKRSETTILALAKVTDIYWNDIEL